MSDNNNQMVGKKGNFGLLAVVSSAAFICGIYASGYCNSAARNVSLVDGISISDACDQFNLTAIHNGYCQTIFGDHSVGFYSWDATVPVESTKKCAFR